jgi:hypothetical protein
MSFRESQSPVGLLQHDTCRSGVQAPFFRPCCPRWRTCLLEGCGRRFLPCCGRRHYCSEACQDAARRWWEWKAQQQYRSSEKGRQRRREQSRRWRERRREAGKPLKNPPAEQSSGAGVGHPQKRISCDRPGCYARFEATARSPRQRFCSPLCRNALRIAWAREERWREGCGDCPLACHADELPEGLGQAAYVRVIDAEAKGPILRERRTGARNREVPDPGTGRGRGALF